MKTFAIAGSRSLHPDFTALVAKVCSLIVSSGHGIVVGCATGADAAVLGAGLPVSRVRCLAAFDKGPRFDGACGVSAVDAVAAHAAAGGEVIWLAGGSLSLKLKVRLSNRTRAVIGAATNGLVVFFDSPQSHGSSLAARLAVNRGLSVFAFACGFPARALPSIGVGEWVPSGLGGALANSFFWSQAQTQRELF